MARAGADTVITLATLYLANNLRQVGAEDSEMAKNAFVTSANSSEAGPTYAEDFGQRKLQMSIDVLNLPENMLVNAWQDCVRKAVPAKIAAEDELAKAYQTHVSKSCYAPALCR